MYQKSGQVNFNLPNTNFRLHPWLR